MVKPITTLNGLKIVIMLGMLVIIPSGIRFTVDIVAPFILALLVAVVLNPTVQQMVEFRISRIIVVSLLTVIIIMPMMLLLVYLGISLNELARVLPQCRSSLVIPLKNPEPWLQRTRVGVSVDELVKYIDPSAATTLVTNSLV